MGYKCNYFWTKAKGQTLNIYPVNSACRAGEVEYIFTYIIKTLLLEIKNSVVYIRHT